MRKTFFFFSLVLAMSSCNDKIELPCGDQEVGSDQLKQKIEAVKNSQMQAEIYSYTYNGSTVIEVKDCVNCADAMSLVYDCSGSEICRFGGIAGFNTCPDFSQKATDKKLLWKN